MRVENIFLAGIGTHVPDRVTAEEAVRRGWYDAADRDEARLISVAVADDTPAPDMAVYAAREALKRSEHDAEDIDALYHSAVHYQGPDVWSAPHYVLRNTVDRPVSAIEVRHGCLGMVASMELGAAALTAVPERTAVLLTTGDNFNTPVVDRWRASKLFVLADGGAAAVLSTRGGFARLLAVGGMSNPGMEELHRGGEVLFPPGITVGRPLDLEARREFWRLQWAKGIVPPMGDLGELVASAVDKTLREAGLTMADITKVANVGLNWEVFRDAFLDPLGIDETRGTWEFNRRMGHAGPVDHIAGLEHLWTTGQVGPGDHVLMLGATPGFEAACAVLEIVAAP
ncbi:MULTISPECIES: ketoacyl-ACP synthase III family protein [Streptomyces]|uniref:3-oxoacyl-ACP synthase n=1 Tax=Streptomyces olivaceus TaxID=47716 RepID=A0A3G8G7K1_STROV|nr:MULTISPECIES: ketoacyl-ACP synthase III family protein [Streptomyces]AZG02879.1 3-oxoacyl-ACP synthase [Streptomyces olivaceus]MBZ6172052.1 ketoacyl-ACP synthase III family protein [Streptomyces olivaceus]MBZ6181106.1 ketoacyl-ACP synthase III family protein [Streptomyces olivaceus]MCM8554653.1 ketoacyl-ACP synthase III family protein [Streptomyces sp. STCH 565 A]WFB84926.1 ketoacyl-ACP synthase III family protein [Streptomyces olivaceus]